MEVRFVNAPEAPVAAGGYAQGIEVTGAKRLLFISGQIPETVDGHIPDAFDDQARLAWANVEAQLRAAGMTFDNLVKVTTILPDRQFVKQNREIRGSILGRRQPALTLLIAGIFDERWLLEIEAVAAS